MSGSFRERRKEDPMQKLLDRNYSFRSKMTYFVLATFILTIAGIVVAIYTQSELNQEWKEILLLMLGAFIAAYGKVIDFWFNLDRDKEIIDRADREDDLDRQEWLELQRINNKPTTVPSHKPETCAKCGNKTCTHSTVQCDKCTAKICTCEGNPQQELLLG